MFARRLVICAVGAALALAAPSVRSDVNGSQAKQAAISVPMTVINCGSNDECYRVEVSVGTPPQTYRLTLDNEMETIFVFWLSARVSNSTCRSVDIERKRFNPSASSTYMEDGEAEIERGGEPYYPYEDPKCTKEPFGWNAQGFKDTVQIGTVSVPSVPANMIVAIRAPLNPQWDADGFLGIYPPYNAIFDSYDTTNVFLSAFEKPSLTLYYARVEYFDQDSDKAGVLTFGGADTSNCDSEWTKIPSSNAFIEKLMMESVSIKGMSFRSWKYALIDVTTSYIMAPQTVIDAVVKATGAEYDFKTDTYQVDCNKRASFPDMVFKLPGMEYHVPAVDYARRRSASRRRCTLMLVDARVFPDSWSLGTSFLRPYCTLLDFKTNTFSLAKALH